MIKKDKSDSTKDINNADGGSASYHMSEDAISRNSNEMNQKPITPLMGLLWCVIQGLTRGSMYSG